MLNCLPYSWSHTPDRFPQHSSTRTHATYLIQTVWGGKDTPSCRNSVCCGKPGHLICLCPSKSLCLVANTIKLKPVITQLLKISAKVLNFTSLQYVSALVDSSSYGNFLSQDCLDRFQLCKDKHDCALKVQSKESTRTWMDQVVCSSNQVTSWTISSKGDFWYWRIPLLMSTWFALHSPVNHWILFDIILWSDYYRNNCLFNLLHFIPVTDGSVSIAKVCHFTYT